MEIFLSNLVCGISYGMILFLLASGLSIIFGTMGILNLAHGAFYLVGAYVGLTVALFSGNWLVGLLASGVGVAVVGSVAERTLIRRLYRQLNEQVLLTLGLVYIFANVVVWIWGPYPKMGSVPLFVSGSLVIGSVSIPVYRFLLVGIGLAIFTGLWWLQDKTRMGAILRAGMDDKQMTIGLGVNYGLISGIIFILGALMGGFAGFLGAPILGAFPDMSMSILLLAFATIIVGGVGRVQGALLGAVVIGLIDSFGKAYFPDFAMFTIYLTMIIIILVKPSGLLGRRG